MNFKLEHAIGYTMEKTVKLLRDKLTASFQEAGFDITPYQFHILFMLWDSEGLFLSQLKQGSLVDNATVTRNVDFLEKNGYVERRPGEDDRRKIRLYLTDKGRTAKDILLPVQIAHYTRSRQGISDSEMRALYSIAEKVKNNLED